MPLSRTRYDPRIALSQLTTWFAGFLSFYNQIEIHKEGQIRPVNLNLANTIAYSPGWV